MKGNWLSNFLENKKALRTGCGLMAAVVLLSGALYVYDSQTELIPELPVIVDGEGTTLIDEDEVPLAAAPKTTTKTTTKKTTKKVKLAKASTKSYSKTKTTKKTKTTTTNSSKQTVKKVVTTTTTTLEKFVKNSKVKTVTTTVKTVTKTTTTPKQTTTTATKASTKTASDSTVKKDLNVKNALPKADTKVLNAFTKLGFTAHVDSTVNYSGKFDSRARTITMRKENDDAIYHEMGHFLMFMANNLDTTSEAASVYAAEKSKYTGANKTYVNQNAAEYFAEAYRDYCTAKSSLKSSRPQTYALVQKALDAVTDAQVSKYKIIYSPMWK